MEKNFTDFIESIDEDTYTTIVHAAHTAMRVTNQNDEDARAFFIARELLERYHNWLSE